MASGHEMNFSDDPDHSHSCTAGNSCNLNDSSSLPEENMLGSFSSNKGSQPLFHQYHGNEPTTSQDLHSSSHEPLNYKMKSIPLCLPQPGGISNILESSHPLHHQSSENVSSMVQGTKLFFKPRSEIRFSGNEDAVPHISSGTEFGASQNSHSFRQDLCIQKPSENDGSHPPITQSFDCVPSANRQLLSERHNFPENRCNTIQEMRTQTELGFNESSRTQGYYPSAHQFAGRNMNRFQGYDSLFQQQSGNETIASRSSHPLSLQPHKSISNIDQRAFSVSRKVFGNEFNARNTRRYFHYSGKFSRIQDSLLKSFQHSVRRLEDIQMLHPQGLLQFESYSKMMRNKYSSSHPAMGIDSIQDNELHPATREIPNQSIANRDLHSLTRQPAESETREIKGLHPLPQELTEDIPNKNKLLHSHSEQQFQRGSYAIPHAESQPITSDTSYPLPGNSPGVGNFISKKQNILSDQAPVNAIGIEYAHLSMIQQQCSNPSEPLNILVYGPADWTSRLLQTFAGESFEVSKFSSPYSLSFQQNITRCGILMTVSVWQMDDLIKSGHFLKSCLSSRSTIMFALNAKDRVELFSTLHPNIHFIRRDISWSVPIILVASKVRMGISGNQLDGVRSSDSLAFTNNTGFRMKARYDLSAFLECSVDSTEEVNAVIFTAIDVSFLARTVKKNTVARR
ncbi:hypothetical protein AVEN_122551-1 [Araneus ventricosus]|uniref:Uncharacterized protein n=1 Tax=Araneus ventricosus TaxID=182803 RepID=A0A4Y2IQM5_ARAVE|nr:hypothetical protein AVEN_122551-1 [Araneus ventricosus]